MYRFRILLRLKSASVWNEALALNEKLNKLSKERGWTEGTIWTQTVGPFNEILIEEEYADLATFERESAAFYADPEVIALLMELDKLTRDDAGHSELWQRAEGGIGLA